MAAQQGKTAAGKYHEPVLKREVIRFLLGDTNGIYVDATLGGAGHANYLLQHLDTHARLIGIDVDADALAFAAQRVGHDSRFQPVRGNFSQIADLLATVGVDACDGILADLGVSSHQIDTAGRGFSFMRNGPLDMRMDAELGLSAAELIEQSDEKELAAIFREYGEERHARRIARAVVDARRDAAITTTQDLVQVLERVVPERFRIKTLARVFQALRISVNKELDALRSFLPQAFALLKAGGRFAVISYHSLEDRIVKRFMVKKAKDCICPPEMPVCQCGHRAEGKLLTRKTIVASEEEIHSNPRARSAKLRAIEKIAIQ